MKLVYADEATEDLVRIGDHIALDNPWRAVTFIDELRTKCATLTAHPLMYPLVPRYERFGVRRAVHKTYLIFYRVGEEDVTVVHVLSGAMDYESALFPAD